MYRWIGDSMKREFYELQADYCKALSNPLRLEIIDVLKDGELAVAELASRMGARQSTISQHLSLLRERGIVAPRKQGQNVYYRIANQRFAELCSMVAELLAETLSQKHKMAEIVLGGE